MRKDLDEKLCKRFPVLYQDRRSPMQETCMCWGFDCGDGWFEIIWQLSLAIEEELGYSWLQERWFLALKQISRRWNKLMYKLSPVSQVRDTDEKGNFVKWRTEPTWDEKLATKLFGQKEWKLGGTVSKTNRLFLKKCVWHPNTGFAVMQVKEKFGTLRYYCPHTDAIYKYISLAETLSAKRCEACGERGQLREDRSWWQTLCDKCAGEEKPVGASASG